MGGGWLLGLVRARGRARVRVGRLLGGVRLEEVGEEVEAGAGAVGEGEGEGLVVVEGGAVVGVVRSWESEGLDVGWVLRERIPLFRLQDGLLYI